MVFQLAWVGRLVAGFVNHMCGCPTRMGGPRWGGLRHMLAWKPVRINLYRGPRGRGLLNKVRCPTRMGGPRGGGLGIQWHESFCIRLLEWAAGEAGFSQHMYVRMHVHACLGVPWWGWGLCKGKPQGRFRDGRVRGAQLIQVIGA